MLQYVLGTDVLVRAAGTSTMCTVRLVRVRIMYGTGTRTGFEISVPRSGLLLKIPVRRSRIV